MTDTQPATGMARTAQILGFLLKYRHAGVFAGLHADEAALSAEVPSSEAGPEQFVRDLEALGPAFVKIGQSLSTRPDMVPQAYIDALERMQDDVAALPAETVRGLVEEALGVRPG